MRAAAPTAIFPAIRDRRENRLIGLRLGVDTILHSARWWHADHRWADGKREYRYNTGEPAKEYLAWVEEQKGHYDKDTEMYDYIYDIGSAP